MKDRGESGLGVSRRRTASKSREAVVVTLLLTLEVTEKSQQLFAMPWLRFRRCYLSPHRLSLNKTVRAHTTSRSRYGTFSTLGLIKGLTRTTELTCSHYIRMLGSRNQFLGAGR
jgi:hypothetical protein